MASTIQLMLGLTRLVDNNQGGGSIPPVFKNIETTSDLYTQNVQNVGTSAETIDLGDVSGSPMTVIKNEHASATVRVGRDASGFQEWFSIPPGEHAILPRVLTTGTVQLISDTTDTPVLVSSYTISS